MLNIALLGRQPKHCEIFFFPKLVLLPFLLTVLQENFLFLGILTSISFNILVNLKGGGQKHSAHTFWSVATKLEASLLVRCGEARFTVARLGPHLLVRSCEARFATAK